MDESQAEDILRNPNIPISTGSKTKLQLTKVANERVLMGKIIEHEKMNYLHNRKTVSAIIQNSILKNVEN